MRIQRTAKREVKEMKIVPDYTMIRIISKAKSTLFTCLKTWYEASFLSLSVQTSSWI